MCNPDTDVMRRSGARHVSRFHTAVALAALLASGSALVHAVPASAANDTAHRGVTELLGIAKQDRELDWAMIEDRWDVFRAEVSETWGDLTDEDWVLIDAARDQEDAREKLVSVIAERTGDGTREVERELYQISERL